MLLPTELPRQLSWLGRILHTNQKASQPDEQVNLNLVFSILGMLLLLRMHALIHCLAAYIYTVLVSLLFGTVISTSFNISKEIFYSCFTGFSLYTTQFRCMLTRKYNFVVYSLANTILSVG